MKKIQRGISCLVVSVNVYPLNGGNVFSHYNVAAASPSAAPCSTDGTDVSSILRKFASS